VPWLFVLGVVVSVELVVWTGQATDWFGWTPQGAVSPSSPPGPNPNPFNETVQSVIANVTYTGNLTGYFPALEEQDICNHCPRLPIEDDAHDPPTAGFWFYFNVTNNAPYTESIVNFTLTTSGANPQLFLPGYVVCCAPSYNSYAAQVVFPSGLTVGLGAFVTAASLPNVGPSGFILYFNVTAPQTP
jgi:hypothetical protein